MARLWTVYLLPALVIHSVLVGGGFATGRELVEFFLSMGVASGLLGLSITTILFSACAAIAFELARRHRSFDYNSLNTLYLGRFRFAFEFVYFCGLLLVLAIVCAAAGELIAGWSGQPRWVGSAVFMAAVAGLLFFNTSFIERFSAVWSLVFFSVFCAVLALVAMNHPDAFSAALLSGEMKPRAAAWNGLSYAAYNAPLIVILIFVARRFSSAREALTAGLLVGPLALAPAFFLFFAMAPFSPEIDAQPLPIVFILNELGKSSLSAGVQAVIFGALITTGAGLLLGLNERLAHFAEQRGRRMPPSARGAVAIAMMTIAVYGAASIGLIDLIGRGYRYVAVFYIAVFIAPILIVGGARILRGR